MILDFGSRILDFVRGRMRTAFSDRKSEIQNPRWAPVVSLVVAICPLLVARAAERIPEEFRVKRQAVYEFASKPKVTRRGDKLTIAFETKGLCDVTVAVENAEGRIVRHLACGVLGRNAPPPFARGSRKQTLVWDGKDDGGRYIDDKESHTIRVSLGLAPRFERTLLWSPERRVGVAPPIMRPAKEGVYVYQGRGFDHLRLFDHDGNYVRTVYPFPAAAVKKVRGLKWFDFPQGYRLPLKVGSYQQTLLTSGDNAGKNGMGGRAATAMAVRPSTGSGQSAQIALLHERINRLGADGTSGGMELLGAARLMFPYRATGTNADHKLHQVAPTSAAFSPDGKTLYLAGYAWRYTWSWDMHNGAAKVPFVGAGKVELFAGSMKQGDSGAAPGRFNGASSVAVDGKGRVYLSDYVNDRVQVFSPAGKFLKAIAVHRPAQVEVHPRTGDVYVFSWAIVTRAQVKGGKRVVPRLTRFGPFQNPRKLGEWKLPLPAWKGRANPWWTLPGLIFRGALDGWADPPRVWLAGGTFAGGNRHGTSWEEYNPRVFRLEKTGLKLVKNFGKAVVKKTGRERYAPFNYQMQRLTVDHRTGRVYLAEPDSGPANKAYKQLVRVDPETGKHKLVDLPFNAEDLCFDKDGLVYLRSTGVVVRYDPRSWREVPWDYGEQFDAVTCGMYGRAAPAISGLRMPSTSPVCFHQGGMYVSLGGHLAVSCAYRSREKPRKGEEKLTTHGRKYKPLVYPGRMFSSTGACLHVWDKHGKLVHQDALPGMPQADGLGVDARGDIYVMVSPARVFGGKRYFNPCSQTLMKFAPGKGKFISGSARVPVAVTANSRPKGARQVAGYWVKGAQWFYGGAGFAGFSAGGPGCACWHCRFTLDFFARSFAPEIDQYRVAVLDSAGNLITRIGRYGNVDDGRPLVTAGGPEKTRPLGGDEVSLFYGAFLATHTDRRLFIADAGTRRLLSVKLGYHAEEKVALKNVPDEATKR
jgi:sugar lactone lactonase YvrE